MSRIPQAVCDRLWAKQDGKCAICKGQMTFQPIPDVRSMGRARDDMVDRAEVGRLGDGCGSCNRKKGVS